MVINGKPFNPGELRTQITLKQRSVTAASGGFKIAVAGDTIATVWSKWENAHGPDVWAAQSVGAVAPATVTIRYRSDVDPSCYVQRGSELYEIISMDNIRNRNEYIEMKVKQVVEG
jgi:SPP1 family predicted phage head-tail adaptor